MTIETLYPYYLNCSSVSTDSRKIEKNALYIALKGENFDGNKFAKDAYEKGANYCIVDDEDVSKNNPSFIYVEDSLKTLQDLAKYHRSKLNYPIIGLTGSNGKTTTKELINAVLSSNYNTKATQGNLNNHIGVPLTLLSFKEDADFGIVEMGANHQKEIAFLSSISQPDYGLITNFGKAHLEGFGGVEGVIKGKSELYDYLKANNKTAFINCDDKIQLKKIANYKKVVSFGQTNQADYEIKYVDANPFVRVEFKNKSIQTQLIGSYNFGNIAVAIAIGSHFGVSDEKIILAIENYKPKNNRSEIIKKGSKNIILDAYNANPTSMKAALTNFSNLNAKNKILFLGDMFELGEESALEHQSIVDIAESQFKDGLHVIGKHFFGTDAKKTTHKFASFEDLKTHLKSLDLEETTILIKGSRGMALERILELL